MDIHSWAFVITWRERGRGVLRGWGWFPMFGWAGFITIYTLGGGDR